MGSKRIQPVDTVFEEAEIQEVSAENLPADPNTSKTGRFYFNTVLKTIRFYTDKWVSFLTENTNHVITGLFTFNRGEESPFKVNENSAKVENLDADKLDGFEAREGLQTGKYIPVTTEDGHLHGAEPTSNSHLVNKEYADRQMQTSVGGQEFFFTVPMNEWVAAHNINNPLVQVFNDDGEEIGGIITSTTGMVRVKFSADLTGKIVLK